MSWRHENELTASWRQVGELTASSRTGSMALLILPPTEIIIFGILLSHVVMQIPSSVKLTFIQFSLAFYRNNFHLYLSTTSVSQSAHSTSMIQFTTTSSKSNPSTTVSKMPILWFNTRSVHDDHTKQLYFSKIVIRWNHTTKLCSNLGARNYCTHS